LHELQGNIEQHRDPQWKRYVRNCLVVAGILLTGVVPGLLMLALYSDTGNNRSAFFWRSKGENLVNECLSLRPEM
jgi:hypothetical protein